MVRIKNWKKTKNSKNVVIYQNGGAEVTVMRDPINQNVWDIFWENEGHERYKIDINIRTKSRAMKRAFKYMKFHPKG